MTVVDALKVEQTVAAHHTAADQIAIADTLVLSKCDLAAPAHQARVESLIRGLNAQASLLRADTVDDAARRPFSGFRGDGAAHKMARNLWLAHTEHASRAHHGHVYRQHVTRRAGEISLAGRSVFLNRAVNTQREELLRIVGVAAVRNKKVRASLCARCRAAFTRYNVCQNPPIANAPAALF